MAKIRKYKLTWKASDSEMVAGYKLYWSVGMEIGYDSQFIDAGNVTEMELPDEAALANGPVIFGLTAIDNEGNESDMITLAESFQLIVPKAPAALAMNRTDEFKLLDSKPVSEANDGQKATDDPLADAIDSHESQKIARMKYYDDVGYR